MPGDDPMGAPVPHHATEIRSRWTRDNLYLLFICHFDKLYLKPNPVINNETNHLWEWDVAEAFIGSDMANIYRYKEFEIRPAANGWIWILISSIRCPRADGFGIPALLQRHGSTR